MIKKIKSITVKILIALISIVILFMSIRGLPGNPNSKILNTKEWQDDGPFELSPERGRYALTYTLIEDKSYFFNVDTARFVVPDLGYINGKYVSLFAPAVSYIAIPGYLIGKAFGSSQFGAFTTVAFFALLNTLLIKLIADRLGANKTASIISALIFLFATPAYSYSTLLYQHHISTFLILMSTYTLLRWNNFWSLSLIWLLCAASIPVDYPNLFLMLPIGIFAATRLISINKNKRRIVYSINVIRLISIVSIIFPLGFFLWFNQNSYGNPLQFSGTVKSVHDIDVNGNPTTSNKINLQNVADYAEKEKAEPTSKKSAISFFKPRNIINGLDIHLFSPDRGIVVFTPIVIFGILGAFLYKQKEQKEDILPVLIGIITADIVLYSMWGDPWGGWAFGSRYLIPSYAILSILISFVLTKLNKKVLFIIPFYIVMVYSIFVNTLGALTTSSMPPEIETTVLGQLSNKVEKYSWDRNWEFITAGKSKSFIFQTYAHKYISALQYFYIIAGSITLLTTLLTLSLVLQKNEQKI